MPSNAFTLCYICITGFGSLNEDNRASTEQWLACGLMESKKYQKMLKCCWPAQPAQGGAQPAPLLIWSPAQPTTQSRLFSPNLLMTCAACAGGVRSLRPLLTYFGNFPYLRVLIILWNPNLFSSPQGRLWTIFGQFFTILKHFIIIQSSKFMKSRSSTILSEEPMMKMSG